MAMIKCPECEKEISDKATVCPNCGCPITEETQKIQQVEIASVTVKPKISKKVLSIMFAGIAVVGICICLFFANKSAQQAKDRERFIELAKSFQLSGIQGAAECETTCNLIKKVWSNTIYKEYDSETIAYTKVGNKFNEDFNVSLRNFFESDTYKDSITTIVNSENELREYLSEMKTISKDYQKCYDAAEAFCKAYYSFTDLATSPSGSLLSYSETFSSLDSDIMTYYKDLEFEIEKIVNDTKK